MNSKIVRIALDVPNADGFDYVLPDALADSVAPGDFVVVPWGRASRVGIVIERREHSPVPADRLRPVTAAVAGAPRLDAHWLRFVGFAARYYHRGVGEVALPAIPKVLRTPPAARSRTSAFERARKRTKAPDAAPPAAVPALTAAQARVLEQLGLDDGFRVTLVHGVTGSGKTEVYLRWIDAVLARDPHAQVLLLVPEIALTPQLLGQVAARFPGVPTALLHSDLPDGERATHWLAAADGSARIVVGTRLAVLVPMPGLAAIVVDEEHDASYKQQEGVRYSARDLAIALASQRKISVVLGSATPSLETWLSAQRGRYRRVAMPDRVSGAALPVLRVVDPRGRKNLQGLAPDTIAAIEATMARGDQALVFINRRGYAPVLTCDACGWVSRCQNCSAYRVLHRTSTAGGGAAHRLVCHHCSAESAVPRGCPDCGNVDLTPTGRGTQRMEEALRARFPQARVARLDRDVARHRGAAREVIDAAHAGDVDLLVGTQMLAKGHDFRRLALVVVVDADSGLYSSDFRAPERLFSLLTQVAGRAGRSGAASEVVVQTRFPGHPIFAALARHDWDGYANTLLAERRDAGLPPFVWQALLRAEARTVDASIRLLTQAKALIAPDAHPQVRVFDPVPMPLMRLAGRERAQLLVESTSRPGLHAFLETWLPRIGELPGSVRWQLDIDPIEI